MTDVESQITEWRTFVSKSSAVDDRDLDELETHLRDQVAELQEAGLAEEEAFLVAVKRMGAVDDLSREFAREHSGRLWKQLMLGGKGEASLPVGGWIEPLAFASAAALAVLIARLAAGFPGDHSEWWIRNLALLVLPFLSIYFARSRKLEGRGVIASLVPFALLALIVNLYPFEQGSDTETLLTAHLPLLLWFAVAYPYMGGVMSHERRMDFVRFTGEWAIYYVLIALGGGVLMGLTALILEPIDPNLSEGIFEWLLPSGAAGAVIVAAWLVESKQQVVENMAPVLTAVFTPLFATALTVGAISYAIAGAADGFDRGLLGVFDAMMVIVLGLVIYALSARDPMKPPGLMDAAQLVAVTGALVLDALVVGSMIVRIGDLGFTPNRVTGLGLNLVLLVNLLGAAWLSARFLLGKSSAHRMERWQTSYLPVSALWIAFVVVMLPPLFSFG